MAKPANTRKAGGKRAPAKKTARTAKASDLDPEDHDFAEGPLTSDAELPHAGGGVAAIEDEVDACDVDFTEGPLTGDDMLPAASGGVST